MSSKVSLIYKVSSRTARATMKDPVSNTKPSNNSSSKQFEVSEWNVTRIVINRTFKPAMAAYA